MKITKFEHACLVVEEQGQKLIIDPGVFSSSCTDFDNVTALVVTHIHPDHFDPEKLNMIRSQHPAIQIFTVQTVADELGNNSSLAVVHDGQTAACGPFNLEFFGTDHALIHPSIPLTKNTAVMVNAALYYPGDSFTIPHKPVDILAVPASGPWMKVGEAMDFITAVKPKTVFPTHNAILSETGSSINGGLLEMACKSVGATYTLLVPGESLDS